jgi:hypothetical protein
VKIRNPFLKPKLLIPHVCRGGYFLLPNREKQSPRSLISVKRSAVQKGEGISKNNGKMSCKFGEIIKKLFHCESEPSQGAIHSGELWRVFIVEQGYIRDPE